MREADAVENFADMPTAVSVTRRDPERNIRNSPELPPGCNF